MLDEAGTDDVIIGFDDESSQRTDQNRCKVWAREKPVKTNMTEVMTVNTMGFYPLNGTPVVYMPERGNSQTFCEFLKIIRNANGDKPIILILDNCRIHKTELAFETADRLDIRFCFLPPYSPQWNPIEFIWKKVKFELSKYGVLARHQVESIVEEVFITEAQSLSYARYWVDFFIDILPKKLCC